jgi:lipopolysaccharide heptosyltransferase II
MNELASNQLQRILAVRLDNIGDMIMLGPALRALKHAYPASHITLLCSPAGSQVAPMLPWVDDVIVLRAVWQDASWTMPLDPEREMALVRDLREREFDAAFIFTSFSQSPYPPACACYLAGIPVRVGQSKEFGGSVLSEWVKPLPDETHQVDRNLHLLEAAGIPITGTQLELHLPPTAQQSAERILAEAGIDPREPYIVLAPGASCQARRYDPARYAEVARILARRTEYPLVVVGSEREVELVRPIVEAAGNRALPLVGRTTIPELAAVISKAALLIANDSGPMHIADAFLTPMVILYSGTEYESQWRPRSAPTTLLRRPTLCSPCYNFRCPYNMECLDFSPEEVAGEAVSLLNRTGGASAHQALSGFQTVSIDIAP